MTSMNATSLNMMPGRARPLQAQLLGARLSNGNNSPQNCMQFACFLSIFNCTVVKSVLTACIDVTEIIFLSGLINICFVSHFFIKFLVFILCQKTGNFVSFIKTSFSRMHKAKTKP